MHATLKQIGMVRPGLHVDRLPGLASVVIKALQVKLHSATNGAWCDRALTYVACVARVLHMCYDLHICMQMYADLQLRVSASSSNSLWLKVPTLSCQHLITEPMHQWWGICTQYTPCSVYVLKSCVRNVCRLCSSQGCAQALPNTAPICTIITCTGSVQCWLAAACHVCCSVQATAKHTCTCAH